jgi:hypothetical protein
VAAEAYGLAKWMPAGVPQVKHPGMSGDGWVLPKYVPLLTGLRLVGRILGTRSVVCEVLGVNSECQQSGHGAQSPVHDPRLRGAGTRDPRSRFCHRSAECLCSVHGAQPRGGIHSSASSTGS